MPIANAEDFLKVVNSKLLFFLNPFHIKELKIAINSSQNHTSPLNIRYWSTTPYLFGECKAIKYSAIPCEKNTQPFPKNFTQNYLKEAMVEQLQDKEVCFDLMVQFQTNPNTMPIEDATILWDEKISPFIKVAKITIPKQKFNTESKMKMCEDISMNPWHSLKTHRPLGSLNRVRKDIYLKLFKLRHSKNITQKKVH